MYQSWSSLIQVLASEETFTIEYANADGDSDSASGNASGDGPEEPVLTGLRVREEDATSLEAILRLFRNELRAPLVKQEPQEDAAASSAAGVAEPTPEETPRTCL